MDVVSDAISTVRTGRPSSRRLRVRGRWCVRLSPYDGAGFHVVLGGGCLLVPEAGGEPVPLGTGDVVLLPHGAGHWLSDGPVTAAELARAVDFEDVRGHDVRDHGVQEQDLRHGQDVRPRGPCVELLCGKYRLDRGRMHPLMAELPQVVHLPNRLGAHPELRSAVDLLARELDDRRPGACLALPGLLDLLLIYMVRAWLDEAESGVWPGALGDPVTTAALRALHSDPAASWTNDRLAQAAGVSRATLARRFGSLVGRPPMAYLTWWRLTLAATRLRDTDAPLAAVARETGYAGPYALSHAFRREFGVTPGRYREALRAG
ncbi:AraC family transcriptional regulator [Streptomyces mangrovisoli]|uniref:AraC family transcriptional regulator n=1 Tax=Streptomyces mangrovisoli TaxID=1428628 RepID=A0A1J4NYK8_9ACTN|nr:AraC family transcriptional regulator [Streptomyces mangrovisoli]OIJ67567.1 AraC family transcriptional regulator [Streptomyces mangrovisoli]